MDKNETRTNVYPTREDIQPQTKSDDFRPENVSDVNANEPPTAPERTA